MQEEKLIADKDRAWKYYRCDNCGHSDRYYNTRRFPTPPVICSTCRKIIPFDQKKEDEWLYALDENGRRKRKDFSGFSERKCRERAAKYFGCDEKEIDYHIVRAATQRGKCIINASRKSEYVLKDGDIKLDMLKLNTLVRSWCVINTDNKTFYLHSETNDKTIHFDGVKAINTKGNTCEVDFLPSGKMRLTFAPGCESNIGKLYDVLKEYLSVKKIGVFTVEDTTKADAEYHDSCQRQTLDHFKYRDLDLKGAFMIWKTKSDLCFFNTSGNKLCRCPLEQIKYYRLIGEKYYTTDVSGGGGGGSSLKGAVVGGVIAGGAGAVIGSRKGIDEVQSSSEVYDEQQLLLYFKEDDQVARMDASMFDVFTEFIPDKDYDIVAVETMSEQGNDSTGNANIELLKQLASLHENGVLTDEEYDSKKAELLSRL